LLGLNLSNYRATFRNDESCGGPPTSEILPGVCRIAEGMSRDIFRILLIATRVIIWNIPGEL
jgi:hypothetical protein